MYLFNELSNRWQHICVVITVHKDIIANMFTCGRYCVHQGMYYWITWLSYFKALLSSRITKIEKIMCNEGHNISCIMLFYFVSNRGTKSQGGMFLFQCFIVGRARYCKQCTWESFQCQHWQKYRTSSKVSNTWRSNRLHSSIICFSCLTTFIFFHANICNCFAKS